jgi:signal transduction histidine kinase
MTSFKDDQIERRFSAQLEALHEATMTITADLTLDRVLQQITHLSCSLASATYAALGVPDRSGGLEQFIVSGISDEVVKGMDHLPIGRGLLGLLVREPRPIRIRRLQDDPRFSGFCEHHPLMISFLGVPIISKGQLLGNLYLTEKIGAEEFSEQDEHLIVMLAAHAAIAIENAHLYAEVQRLAVLEERDRIAMDLHDGIIQSIYAVGLTLEYVDLLLDEQPAVARERLKQSIGGLNEVIRDIRSYILHLHPQRFQSKNLVAGLNDMVRAFKANTFIATEVQASDRVDAELTTEQSAGLFHIAQEALANIAKHAKARKVIIGVQRDTQGVTLSVQDDGRGFDQAKVQSYAGHGLQNMQERAKTLGTEFKVTSAIGGGTRIEVRLPAKK